MPEATTAAEVAGEPEHLRRRVAGREAARDLRITEWWDEALAGEGSIPANAFTRRISVPSRARDSKGVTRVQMRPRSVRVNSPRETQISPEERRDLQIR